MDQYPFDMLRPHLILAPLSLVLTLSLLAADPPPPTFTAATGAAPVGGPLRELKADWSLRLGDKTLAANEFVALRRNDAKLPAFPVETHVILANGDRIPVESPRLAGEKLLFRHPDLGDGKDVSVPLSAVSVLWFAAPDNAEQPDLLRRQLANSASARDRVILRNGDTVDGLLNALDAKRVEIEANKKPVEIALEKVAAVALSADGANKLTPKGAYARVVLGGDGTCLSLASATCDDGATLQGKTAFGAAFRAPLSRVAALDVMQGPAVYLSDLKPAKFEQSSYLGEGGVKWPLAADSAVTGRDLRLGGSTYGKGLGMHARSVAVYAVEGKYRRFEAVVGLDDESGKDGSARVRVLGDGKALDLGGDGELTAKRGPLAIGVKIEGVKELTLEVDFGRRGDVRGHVNWCDARVVK
jgi:hypothetical protein